MLSRSHLHQDLVGAVPRQSPEENGNIIDRIERQMINDAKQLQEVLWAVSQLKNPQAATGIKGWENPRVPSDLEIERQRSSLGTLFSSATSNGSRLGPNGKTSIMKLPPGIFPDEDMEPASWGTQQHEFVCGEDLQVDRQLQEYGNIGDPLDDADVTTLMLRQIPKKLNLEALIESIDRCGFTGKYDFVHLPKDTKKGGNLGFGFVNFKDPVMASRFRVDFENYSFGGDKRIQLAPARVQGLKANLEAFRTPDHERPSSSWPVVSVNGRWVSIEELANKGCL